MFQPRTHARSLWMPAVLLGLAILASAPSARGETYHTCAGFIDSVPATITTQGVWCLRADLSTSIGSGNAITVATNNVIIDCNDFKLGGLSAGAGTQAIGVFTNSRLNTTIRNCNIRGFRYGALLYGGGHTVRNSRFEQITHKGIVVSGGGFQVLSNVILDTGGGDLAMGIELFGTGDAVGNSVDTVFVGAGTGGIAVGIRHSMPHGSLRGNSVREIRGDGGGSALGIAGAYSPSRVMLLDNHVSTGVSSPVAGIGIRCNSIRTAHRGSYVSGFQTPIQGCVDGGGNVTP